MAKKQKKPCDGKGSRACFHQYADLCLAFSSPCWNQVLDKPGMCFKSQEVVTYAQCLEERHECPNTGKVINGMFIPVEGNSNPDHHARSRQARETGATPGQESLFGKE